MSPRAVIVGMPGSGKSTVGSLLARRLKVAFADSDELIEKLARKPIPEIFADDGEPAFRALEEQAIAQALEEYDGVLSLGGGAITSALTRQRLAEHPVVLIEADDQILVDRVRYSPTVRPLLVKDPEGGIARLRQERSPLYYQVASFVVESDQRPPRLVVDQIVKALDSVSTISVADKDRPYDVLVGESLTAQVVRRAAATGTRALVVYSPDVKPLVTAVLDGLAKANLPAVEFELPRGEDAKTMDTVAAAWDLAGEQHIGRDGVVIAIGGGASTDVGGFIAATWLRGIPVIQVPTTVLGMVDAAVGGKTGINTRHGKNLAGAFYPPALVVCDLNALRTLPQRDVRAGLAEAIKTGFISDEEILARVEENGEAVLSADHPALREIIERSIAVKGAVVGKDLRESGLREILNYGHTLAHAIERAEDFRIPHGEAVSIGCVFAAALAEANGIAPAGFTQRHRELLEKVGLPTTYDGNRAELEATMYSDKKVRDGHLRFVVLSDFGQPEILTAPSDLSMAFDAIGAR